MCTLTFFPTENAGFVLTSNRDEAPNRETLMPNFYQIANTKLYFPKDKLAGGTWIGVSEAKRAVCLLNGGFEPHQRKESYRKSRGLIVTELLSVADGISQLKRLDLNGVEPFTLVLIDWKESISLWELVWDGAEAHVSEKQLIPQIWSSSLLYSKAMKMKREQWFDGFLQANENIDSARLLDFHKTAGEGNPEVDLVMDRGFVRTRSISQLRHQGELTEFHYEELLTNQSKFQQL